MSGRRRVAASGCGTAGSPPAWERTPSTARAVSACCCATSSAWEQPLQALLSVFYSIGNIKLAKRTPPGISVRTVSVVRACLGEPRSALGAQPRAVFLAQRRKRQREHHRITERRLQVKPVTVEETLLVGLVFTGVRLVAVQLLDADLRGGAQRIQAPRALARQRGDRRAGDEHPLGNRLKPQVKSHFRARRHQG